MRVWMTLFVQLLMPMIASASDVSSAQYGVSLPVAKDEPVPQGCAVVIPAITDPWTKLEDLESLITKYAHFCRSDLSIIDRIFENEARDEVWAGHLERKIQEAAVGVTGLTIGGECRRSLCRYKFNFHNVDEIASSVLNFNQRFLPLVKTTQYAAGSFNIPTTAQESREYFYSAMVSATFVGPFLQNMLRPPPSKSQNLPK